MEVNVNNSWNNTSSSFVRSLTKTKQEWPLVTTIKFEWNFEISQGKVKFSLCLSKHHAMKVYGGVLNIGTRWR
jgi:hypothetical protein